MVARRRKKASRYRGSHTHGAGSKKKRRGAGNRGGRGMAGTGKRAAAKKTMIWKDLKYFGKHGFKRPFAKQPRAITLSALQERVPELLEAEIASKKGDIITVDIADIGYDKVLAKGKVHTKMNITSRLASEGAVRKVEKAGGKVTLTEVPDTLSKSSEK